MYDVRRALRPNARRQTADKMRQGKRKYAFILIAAVLLAALAAGCLTACNDGVELPEGRPVSWETYLDDAAGKVAERIRLKGGELGVKLTADAKTAAGTTKLLFGLNYDFADIDRSLMVLKFTGDGSELFSLVSDNASTFIDIAPNGILDDAKLKIENLNIFDFFGVTWNPDRQDYVVAVFRDMLVNLGKAFFDEVNVDPAGDRYVFKIADNFKEKGKDYFARVLGVLGDTVSAALLGAFRIESVDELFAMMPDVSGEIELNLGGDSLTLSADGLNVGEGTLLFRAEGITQYELYEDLYDELNKISDDEASYVHTKLGNTYMAGTIAAYDGTSKAVTYDYELNANIDLMTLMLGGSDLTALPDDNYFHFRVTHRCGQKCTEFCSGKLSESVGAVLDIAFSPSDFDSFNVFISLNLHSLVSTEYLEKVSEEVGGLGVNTVPEYVLFSYPDESFREGSALYNVFMALYVNNLFKHGDFVLPPELKGDENDLMTLLFRQFSSSGGYDVDSLVFDIRSNEYGRAEKYDIYKQTVYIVADDVPELKDYGTDIPLLGYEYVTVLDWQYEPQAITSDGLALSNIYDSAGNLVHGVNGDGRYVPMSPEEASSLTEYYILADYTGIDKVTQKKFYAKITDVKSLDLDDREAQDIVLTVSYPNPLYSSSVNELFAGVDDTLCMEVDARVKLTDYASDGPTLYAYSQEAQPDRKFYVEYRSEEAPEFLRARASIEYADGYVKTMDIIGTSDAVVTSDSWIFDYRYYYTVGSGDIEVEFDYFNRTARRTYRIEEPDDVAVEVRQDKIGPYEVGESVYLSTMSLYVTAHAVYSDGRQVEILLRPKDFSINGITLDKSSTNWTSRTTGTSSCVLVFRNSADYVCTLNVLGRRADFVLKVLPPHTQPPEFGFSSTGDMPPFSFTGAKHAFRGQIRNTAHGETQSAAERMYNVYVRVYKGSVNQYGNIGFSPASSDAYEISGFSVGGYSADGDALYIEIPDMLASPWYVHFNIVFASPGYYRVEFVLDGDVYNVVRHYWYLNVDNLPSA